MLEFSLLLNVCPSDHGRAFPRHDPVDHVVVVVVVVAVVVAHEDEEEEGGVAMIASSSLFVFPIRVPPLPRS